MTIIEKIGAPVIVPRYFAGQGHGIMGKLCTASATADRIYLLVHRAGRYVFEEGKGRQYLPACYQVYDIQDRVNVADQDVAITLLRDIPAAYAQTAEGKAAAVMFLAEMGVMVAGLDPATPLLRADTQTRAAEALKWIKENLQVQTSDMKRGGK
jgi:hypothetical protein